MQSGNNLGGRFNRCNRVLRFPVHRRSSKESAHSHGLLARYEGTSHRVGLINGDKVTTLLWKKEGIIVLGRFLILLVRTRPACGSSGDGPLERKAHLHVQRRDVIVTRQCNKQRGTWTKPLSAGEGCDWPALFTSAFFPLRRQAELASRNLLPYGSAPEST